MSLRITVVQSVVNGTCSARSRSYDSERRADAVANRGGLHETHLFRNRGAAVVLMLALPASGCNDMPTQPPLRSTSPARGKER
jgi:hypothetical protein